jgi:hypothetical protein
MSRKTSSAAILVSVTCLLLAGASLAIEAPDTAKPAKPKVTAKPIDRSKVLQVDWEELVPVDDRSKFSLVPPPPLHDYLSGEAGPAAQQLPGSEVNKNLDGLAIRIPGFIVPVDLDKDNRVTEFFLVPYFGACIHVPPPPPNQIVFVKLKNSFALESMEDAYWVTGKMSVQNRKTRFGSAAYSMAGEKVEIYRY